MIDEKFTKEIEAFIAADDKDCNAADGALLLVRINPRNVAYRRFLQMAKLRPRQIIDKILYELKMHLRYRLDGLTREQVIAMDARITPRMRVLFDEREIVGTHAARVLEGNAAEPSALPETLPEGNNTKKGRRQDHDELPKKVQKYWDDAAEVWKKMKSAFENLKLLNDRPACERYDLLKYLDEADKKYRLLLTRYDEYKVKTKKA